MNSNTFTVCRILTSQIHKVNSPTVIFQSLKVWRSSSSIAKAKEQVFSQSLSTVLVGKEDPSAEAFLGLKVKPTLHTMTIYNENTNMGEMGLTIQSIRGLREAIYLKKKKTKHNILCMAVQTAQKTLQDVTKDKSTNVGLPWWRSGWESACQCRRHGFEPWSGRIPHAAEQLGPWATAAEPARLEPVPRGGRGRNSERPAHRDEERSPHRDEEWPPLAAAGESPRMNRRPSTAKNK